MKKLLQKKLEQVFNNLSTPTRLNLVPAKLTHLVELGVSIDEQTVVRRILERLRILV